MKIKNSFRIFNLIPLQLRLIASNSAIDGEAKELWLEKQSVLYLDMKFRNE